MIYWKDVRTALRKHCPPEAVEWQLKEMVEYLNKQEGLSMQAISKLTEGRCGRTSLCLKMRQQENAKA